MQQYVTIQNDRVDKICRNVFGTEKGGIVEKVLTLNYGLSTAGPLLPGGLTILLPDAQPRRAAVVPTVKLWGKK